MKKLIFTSFLAFAALITTAQIQVTPGGYQSYGSTTAPAYGESHHFRGDVVVSYTPTITNSAPWIRGASNYSGPTTPDYTWYGNTTTTGIFHPLSNVLGFSTNGVERARFRSNGQFLMTALSTTASIVPEYSWKADSTTGVYHPAADQIGVATGGTKRMVFDDYGINFYNLQYGLTVNPSSSGNYPNIKVAFPASSYTPTAANSYAYVMSWSGTDKFYVQGNGDITSSGVFHTSDSTIKKNVVTVPQALSKIKKLRGVNYLYNYSDQSLNDNQLKLGLIAQEVQRVVPEAVKITKDGLLSVNYSCLVGLLIEGMKEQEKKIDSLKQRLVVCCPVTTGQRTSGTGYNSPQQDSINKSLQQQINNCCTKANGNNSNAGTTANVATLFQNQPNPFNTSTNIKCFVPDASKSASLLIFDMNGTLKKTISLSGKGEINTTINGKELIAGMYYYTLVIDNNEIDTKKMILTEQ